MAGKIGGDAGPRGRAVTARFPASPFPASNCSQVGEGPGALLGGQREQSPQHLRRRQRVAGGAVPRAVLEGEVVRHVVERVGREAVDQAAGQPHGAEPRAVERQGAGPAQLRADEAPSRTARCAPRRPGRPARRGPCRPRMSKVGRAGHHLVGDAGERARSGAEIGRPGLTSESNTSSVAVAVDHHHRDLGDPVVAGGAHAGGLDVHHREGAFLEQRRALRLAASAQRPSPSWRTRGSAPSRATASRDRHGRRSRGEAEDVAGEHDGVGRAAGQERERAVDQRGGRVGGESGHSPVGEVKESASSSRARFTVFTITSGGHGELDRREIEDRLDPEGDEPVGDAPAPTPAA